jgi:uncharacterized protein (TIGR00730 family)
MKSICVFCGSSSGNNIAYQRVAEKLGFLLAINKLKLIYGGSKTGIMGTLANSVLINGGKITGVITNDLCTQGVAINKISNHINLIICDNLEERIQIMTKLADGFIILPGGYGTLSEMFKVITDAQLNLHKKPCAILNINNYFDLLINFIKHSVNNHFIQKGHYAMIIIDKNPTKLLIKMNNFKPKHINMAKWVLKQSLIKGISDVK